MTLLIDLRQISFYIISLCLSTLPSGKSRFIPCPRIVMITSGPVKIRSLSGNYKFDGEDQREYNSLNHFKTLGECGRIKFN
jgi:hypothetical protein